LSKSSYGNGAVSKEGGRSDKYAGETCDIVRLSEQAQHRIAGPWIDQISNMRR